MSYLKFDKNQLVNLEYSLYRELLRTNRAGSYLCTTLSGCNTRKYHGLLVCPLEELDGGKHVLLSSLDETLIQHGAEFNLGIHKYSGDHYEPKGHKYIRDVEVEHIPRTVYRVGGVVLQRDRLLVENEQQLLIRYTLLDAHSPTTLRFKPFLAFRNVHTLSKANMYANTKYKPIGNGIKIRMYDGYPYLHLQFSKEPEFIPVPHWYYNIEYLKEQHRGYEYQEDLFAPGYFELPIKKGESIVFSAGTIDSKPLGLKQKFTREESKRIPRDTFLGNIDNAAQQFIFRKNDKTDIIAGFPWYGPRTRQTFVALPGLTLERDEPEIFEKVIDTQLERLNDGLFPKICGMYCSEYDAIDASLWFFWALQEYHLYTKNSSYIWSKYGPAMKQILNGYAKGQKFNIKMNEKGLISGTSEDIALTWMDSYIDGKPVVHRPGMAVEVNALWYNAICFALELAQANADKAFVDEWEPLSRSVARSFIETFWDDGKGYLADYATGNYKNWEVRPNMLIAAALDYSPLDREKQKLVLSVVKKQLLTPRGLRSLSPQDPLYKGQCEGSPEERERAIHQGTVWPWFIQFFVKAYLNIHKRGGLPFVQKLMDGFEEEMSEHCIGTISETYNGNPPHTAKGAISQAWSVAAVIKAWKMVRKYEE
ncbi:MAG: amylo-alpha-1,6-glucosidase [Prolixibacteraceae bacterium]|jgi:predicted glycogen debranching enzyme|nr:amylo-alpha-1,6-glucosidase [Prolixibacteraceae bacterium]